MTPSESATAIVVEGRFAMEGFSYLATVFSLTLPLLLGFLIIALIVVGLGILGAELYTENDTKKGLRPRDANSR